MSLELRYKMKDISSDENNFFLVITATNKIYSTFESNIFLIFLDILLFLSRAYRIRCCYRTQFCWVGN